MMKHKLCIIKKNETMKKVKKILKFVLIFLMIATIVFLFLANRNLVGIYGGNTKQVDFKQFKPKNSNIVINNVNVMSPDGKFFIAGQSILIENGTIVAIDSMPKTSTQATVINGEGKYLIPGLIDSHVHLFKSPNDLLLYVANGVTQIREMIGESEHLEWRQQIKEGRIGPDMFVASPRCGSFGFFEGLFMSWSQGYVNVQNTKDAENTVKKFHDAGYDAVKIYSQLNSESYQSLCKTGNSLGMKVVGHLPWSIELSEVFANKQHEIAHLEEIMNAFNREFDFYEDNDQEKFLTFVEKRSAQIAPDLINNNISVTTTLWLTQSFVKQKFELENVLKSVELEYENPGISEWDKKIPGGLGWLPEVNRYRIQDDLNPEQAAGHKKWWETYAKACEVILKTLSSNGVKIMAGTDANLPPTVPGFSLHDELVSLVNAGMTPSQVLESATSIPANWLNTNTGKITPGSIANLVLLDKDPLTDIKNTQTINAVILKGRLFNRIMLNNILASVNDANNVSRKIDIKQWLNE
jgi:Amidohydrolase family